MSESSGSLQTRSRCKAILPKIAELCEAGGESDQPAVSFSGDWGAHTLTVWLGSAHAHVGIPGGTFEQMVDGLHSLLCKGAGLSMS